MKTALNPNPRPGAKLGFRISDPGVERNCPNSASKVLKSDG